MAGIFGVSNGAYYRWAKYGVSERRKEADAELVELIRLIAAERRRRYGSPRMREAFRLEYGKRVSRKKAARLMRENGLNARRRRKFIPTTNSNHGLPVCENLLNREFHVEGGGEKWVSSYQRYAITYLRTTQWGKVQVCFSVPAPPYCLSLFFPFLITYRPFFNLFIAHY
jgi:hypothetical protein